MRFEVQRARIEQERRRLLIQEYDGVENQATEALFKWFSFSRLAVQKKFLSKICRVRGKRTDWRRLALQEKGKKGTADARIELGDARLLLFEIKVKQNAIGRKQLRRHLKDSGWKKAASTKPSRPYVVLITPDFVPPAKLQDLPTDAQKAVHWVPWSFIINFLETVRGLHSDDKLLRDALLSYLKKSDRIARYLPRMLER